MIGARARVILVLSGIALLAAAVLAFSRTRGGHSREKPPLMLLTSLPIAFGETFSLEPPKSPILVALQKDYRVIPIPTASASELRQGRLLLMIQPFAQPSEDLVALDRWVRSGGRLVLLADPLLERADGRPLDDLTRPPPMFLDTGLLAHWGLRLDGPAVYGPGTIELGGTRLETRSPGTLDGGCAISSHGAVARCTIGKGRATVVADADFLDSEPDRESARALGPLITELEAKNPQ
jgi:hypothetical protein